MPLGAFRVARVLLGKMENTGACMNHRLENEMTPGHPV